MTDDAHLAEIGVHRARPGANNPPGHCAVCQKKLTRVAHPYRGSDHLWVHADTNLEVAANPPKEVT